MAIPLWGSSSDETGQGACRCEADDGERRKWSSLLCPFDVDAPEPMGKTPRPGKRTTLSLGGGELGQLAVRRLRTSITRPIDAKLRMTA